MTVPTTGLEWVTRLKPDTENLLLGAIVLNFEALLLGGYVLVSRPQLTSFTAVRYWIYPFVWINVALWAVVKTRPTPTASRRQYIGALVALGYFLVLSYFGGIVGLAVPGPESFSVSLFDHPPGWSPLLVYNGTLLSLVVLPYKLIGYLALSYLVFVTLLDATGSAVTGVLGLLSCVSCTWPILATLVTGIAGSGTAVAGAVYAQSYDLSTLVFVVTVALLYWRPFGR